MANDNAYLYVFLVKNVSDKKGLASKAQSDESGKKFFFRLRIHRAQVNHKLIFHNASNDRWGIQSQLFFHLVGSYFRAG